VAVFIPNYYNVLYVFVTYQFIIVYHAERNKKKKKYEKDFVNNYMLKPKVIDEFENYSTRVGNWEIVYQVTG